MAGTTGLEPATSAVTESLADVTYWELTVLTARSHSFKGTHRNSPTSLLDPERTQIGRSGMKPSIFGYEGYEPTIISSYNNLQDAGGP